MLYFLLKFILSKLVRTPENLPLGPPALPIIGHLHLLKEPVHRTLHQLSQKYGLVMLLKFGVRKVLVVSSPQAAEECFTKNDIVFANRPKLLAGKLLNYNSTTMGFAPYGDHWRNLRRLTALEIFSPSRLAIFSSVRRGEVRLMLQQLSEFSGEKLDLRSIITDLSFNILKRMIAGKRYYGKDANVMGEEARLFKSIMREAVELHGNSNLGDYFPLFQWVDIQGVQKRMVDFSKKMDDFIQNLVNEHKKNIRTETNQAYDAIISSGRDQVNRKTLIDVMLSLQETEPDCFRMKSSKVSYWPYLVLGQKLHQQPWNGQCPSFSIIHKVMNKAFHEIEACCGRDHLLDEQNLPKLTYVRNIVDETLRLFPPTPLLLPHESSDNCRVCGFEIPRGTMLLVNVWTIHRDPELWEDSTAFKPERFGREEVAEGTYKLIPFGAGRRSCPGASLGRRVVTLALGALIQCFEWKRVGLEEIDMTEGTGLTMPKSDGLEAICRPRGNTNNLLS